MLDYPLGPEPPPPGTLIPVAPGIAWWSVPVPGPLRQVNGYLLGDGEAVTAVDTGFRSDEAPAHWRAILGDRRVGRVVLTHHHPDHAGFAGRLAAGHGAPIAASAIEWLTLRRLVAEARPQVPSELPMFWLAAGWSADEVARGAAQGWDRFAALVEPLPFGYERLDDGDILTVGGHRWRVWIGQGHSPAHVCLLDEARGILIAGDQLLPRISSNVSLSAAEPVADPLGEWLASLARLRMLPADLLVLPGHGAPFRGLRPRIDAIAAEHATRLDALHAFLAEPQAARDCFPALFRRPIGPDALWLATGEALAHLRRLEVEGRATRITDDGVWRWSAA